MAKAVASSEKGTSSVARSTGRRADEGGDRFSRERVRRSVNMLFRVELPAGRASRGTTVSAPPARQNDEEPERHHDRHEQDEARADDDDQRDHDRRSNPGHCERLELVAPHSAKEAFVLLGRDLPGVPRAPARLAPPAVAVGDVLALAAVAFDGDRWPPQTEPIVRRGSPPGPGPR